MSNANPNQPSNTRERLDRWREDLDAARRDPEWSEHVESVRRKRQERGPQLRLLVDTFLGASAPDVEALRADFHTATFKLDILGLKGLSGAMFLNTLVKHLPDREELTRRLQRLLPLPASLAEGEERLRSFYDWLEGQSAAGVFTGKQIQPSRLPFFASACWHLRDSESWPVYFASARKVLTARGAYEAAADHVETYLRFRTAYLDLVASLGTDALELEQLCVRLLEGEVAGGAKAPEPPPTEPLPARRVWLYAPGPGASEWEGFHRAGIAAIGWPEVGDLSGYDSVEAIRDALARHREGGTEPRFDALACWQFAHEMQPGDEVFAKRGRSHIVGYGVVESDYRYDPSWRGYPNVREVRWERSGDWRVRDRTLVMKTLTDITGYPQLVRQLHQALEVGADAGDDEGEEPGAPLPEAYTLEHATRDVFAPAEQLEETLALLRTKKNLILQGPPGVGKTFVAKRLAYLLAGARVHEQICAVQLHPSYAYEDFVQGYRPAPDGGFQRMDGPFLRICDRALQDPTSPYVIIIDEINRGNLSKVLGELMLLIEHDKRREEWATTLAYMNGDDAPFYVPPNLHIIGTMNTADRSLALVDYALRRRFAFVTLEPGLHTPGFAALLRARGADAELIASIRDRIARLNGEIARDPDLGDGFAIGHSYFCADDAGPADEAWYERIVRTEIEPLLREYWFDADEKVSGAVEMLLEG